MSLLGGLGCRNRGNGVFWAVVRQDPGVIVGVIWPNQNVKLAALLAETGLYQVLSGSRSKHKHLLISEWKDYIL